MGWLVISFALIPLAMAAHGDGLGYVCAGLGMVAFGATLVVVPRLVRGR